MKEGFNATGAKYFHVYLSIIGAVAMAVTATCVFWNTDSEVTHIKKLNFPGYKYSPPQIDTSFSHKKEATAPMTTFCNASRRNQEEFEICPGLNDPTQ